MIRRRARAAQERLVHRDRNTARIVCVEAIARAAEKISRKPRVVAEAPRRDSIETNAGAVALGNGGLRSMPLRAEKKIVPRVFRGIPPRGEIRIEAPKCGRHPFARDSRRVAGDFDREIFRERHADRVVERKVQHAGARDAFAGGGGGGEKRDGS